MSNRARDDHAKKAVSRREILLAGAAGLGGLTASRLLGAAPPDRRPTLPASTPKLIIARGPSPSKNLEALLGRLGGLEKFISQGDVVLVKPNVGWDRTPAQGANTHPELVAALIRACRAAGAKEVIVCDNSVNQPKRSFERSGIRVAAEQAGARVILPSDARTQEREIPGKPGKWAVLDPLLSATKVINVPVAKHHGLTQFTCGMKNWIGAVVQRRQELHSGIDQSIVGLALLMRPTLTVVDATRVLLRNGPAGGNLADVKRLDTVALGFDPVAIDAWAATELGFDPARIGHLVLAEKKKLGRLDWKSLQPIELKV